MEFKEWLNEEVEYSPRLRGWVKMPQDLYNLPPDKKQVLRTDMFKVLNAPDERWNGRNPKHFVNAVRHKFLNYNDEMDKLRMMSSDRPGRCKKIPVRIQNIKKAYELTKAIINVFAPPDVQTGANSENYAWLAKSMEFYRNEDMKLGSNCERFDPKIFTMPPA